jgi:hypothetical protein
VADQPKGQSSTKAALRFVTENARFQHVFVVGRVWRSLPEGRDIKAVLDDLTLTKAFFTEGDANDEAARLNALNGGDNWLYFVSVARLVPGSDLEGTDSTG